MGRVTIFTATGCQGSEKAKRVLAKKGIAYDEINVDLFPGRANTE